MPKKKKDEKRSYGKYTLLVGGVLYASVNLRNSDGSYKKKRKRVKDAGEALRWALAEIDKHKQGDAPTDDVSKMSFSELATWYKKEFLIAPVYKNGSKLEGQRTYKQSKSRLKTLEEFFGFERISQIDIDRIRAFKRRRLKTVSITAVNRDLEVLRTMLRKAKSRRWIPENPFESGEPLIEKVLEQSRDIKITDRIYKRLLAKSRHSKQELLFYLILVLAHTGARPSEVYPFHAHDEEVPIEPLTWQNILEFDYKAIRLVSYKGRIRQERLVPCPEYLEKHLRALHEKLNPLPTDLVFPVKEFKRSWSSLVKSARVGNVWIRDFRRYFNTRLAKLGVDDIMRQLLLGHSESATNKRYTEMDLEFVGIIRKRIDNTPQGIINRQDDR